VSASMVEDDNADPIWGGSKPKLVTSIDVPLLLKPARLPDPTTIPPRRWLMGTQLLRGFVTVLVAPGGTGKSIYAMTAALALATGRKLLGLHIWERANVAVINEDPLEELERRLAAIIIRHKIDDTEVHGHYFMNSMDERQILMASKDSDGFTVVHPDEAALIEQIAANQIGLLVVDPFAESHSLEENSNPDMIKAAAAWRRVARATGCAIMLIHHVRKGAAEGSIDAARGAKALTDSARVGLLMQSMTEVEAEKLNILPEDRFTYVRVDDAKVNLSPRIDRAKWFKLDTVTLHNETKEYPSGDHVAAMVPWDPPKLWGQSTVAQIHEILDLIPGGFANGIPYSGTRKGGSDRWAGEMICRVTDVSEKQAQMMIDEWLKSGLLFQEVFKHPILRKERLGLKVDDTKRPTLGASTGTSTIPSTPLTPSTGQPA